jgi:hypothetical protein
MDSRSPFLFDLRINRLPHIGQRIDTKTPLLVDDQPKAPGWRGPLLREPTSSNTRTLKTNSRRASRQARSRRSRASATSLHTSRNFSSASAAPRLLPHTSGPLDTLLRLPAFPPILPGFGIRAIDSTPPRPSEILPTTLHIHHKTGSDTPHSVSSSFSRLNRRRSGSGLEH